VRPEAGVGRTSRPGVGDNECVRLFVACEVPAEVADVLAVLDRPAIDGLRWTTREQWHVTLRFLGEMPDAGPVCAAMATVPARLEASAGNLEVDAVLGPVTAWFPGRQVLHAPVRGLDTLAACVVEALTDTPELSELVGADPVRFSGHLTLARVKGRIPGPGRLAGVPVHAEWAVPSFALMSSMLGPGGARYDTVAAVPLTP
jgi:RNA 2',3'-cyclic 3'-phosphodiesterase